RRPSAGGSAPGRQFRGSTPVTARRPDAGKVCPFGRRPSPDGGRPALTAAAAAAGRALGPGAGRAHRGGARRRPISSRGSVAVVIRLVGTFDGYADVLGLLGRQLREPHAELLEVQARDHLVELLRQHVHLLLV